jgi:fructose-1-phosphate kinase PfkB-like protein
VVPLGSHGALLATPLRSQRFSTIPMPSGSGAGAGDAMVAAHEELHAVAEAGIHAKLMLRIQ